MRIVIRILTLLLAGTVFAQSNFKYQNAKAAYDEFTQACTADAGRLWGHTLCGPMLFVDPASRDAFLLRFGEVLRGDVNYEPLSIPRSENIANTAVEFRGLRVSEIMWPLPSDREQRDVLLAHEAFHRLQKELKLQGSREGGNQHLDSLEGRYWMRLEYRALASALRSHGNLQEEAMRDALAFRTKRYSLFAAAAEEERGLEVNEGLAEYTGVRVGIADPARQIAYALEDLKQGEAMPSFVRAFAYATGPAYGLLLDRRNVAWHSEALGGKSVSQLLAQTIPGDRARAAENLATRYDGAALRKEEEERDALARKKKAEYRAKLVDGPVLRIPLENMNIEFNPNQLFSLEELGTVYPRLRITDVWGELEVNDGAALVSPEWNAVTVPAPDGEQLQGSGWKLHLKEGYRLLPDKRPGDVTVGKAPAS